MRTVTLKRAVAAPIDEVFDWFVDGKNWADVPGMFYCRVRTADGPEPFGVGSIREFASSGSKVTEVVTAFERPYYMAYQALSTMPPSEHDGGSMTLREIPVGTEVLWSTTFRATTPLFADFVTRLYAPMIKMGFRMLTRAAERALTRGKPNR